MCVFVSSEHSRLVCVLVYVQAGVCQVKKVCVCICVRVYVCVFVCNASMCVRACVLVCRSGMCWK